MQSLTGTLQAPAIPVRADPVGSDNFAKARDDLYVRRPVQNPRLLEAAGALEQGRRSDAERMVARQLAKHPRDRYPDITTAGRDMELIAAGSEPKNAELDPAKSNFLLEPGAAETADFRYRLTTG